MAKTKRRCRGAAATRRALLAAAGPLFAEFGYAATTVCQIARAAGLSPNFVTRYFGSEGGSFLAATKTKLDVDGGLSNTIADFGRQLAERIVDGWEQPGQGASTLTVINRKGRA